MTIKRKRFYFSIFVSVIGLHCIAASHWIRTIGDPAPHHEDNVAGDVIIPLYFNSALSSEDLALENYPTLLAGILDYDPTIFSNPRIEHDENYGFPEPDRHATGMELSPGHYRFTIYDSPLASLGDRPGPHEYLAVLKLRVITTDSGTHTLNFSDENGRDKDGLLLTNVEFAPITLKINQNAVGDWAIYE